MAQPMISAAHSRLISEWEHRVRYNLSESAVHPLSVRELSHEPDFLESLLDQKLNYPHTNGIPELRSRIASMYPDASENQILVTIGAAQANFLTTITLLEQGDEIVMMLPTYKQLGAIGQRFGFPIRTIIRRAEEGWAIDLDALNRIVSDKTKLIYVCNPDNPTGRILAKAEMAGVVKAAERSGAWLLADEVCRGTERVTDELTETFWGMSERVITTNSLSKAYGLPGTRIGWVVAPAEIAHKLWSAQDTVTICAGMLDNRIAAYALQPDVQARLFRRTRDRIRKGYARLARWLDEHSDMFWLVPPQAAALAFVGYRRSINSSELALKLIKQKSILMVPGDGFGVDLFLRISFDVPEDVLLAGLDGLYDILHKLP
jgi:aspartate/methionine/tyrosine aminotransferase